MSCKDNHAHGGVIQPQIANCHLNAEATLGIPINKLYFLTIFDYKSAWAIIRTRIFWWRCQATGGRPARRIGVVRHYTSFCPKHKPCMTATERTAHTYKGVPRTGQTPPLAAPVRIIEDLSLKFATYIRKAAEPSRSQKYSIPSCGRSDFSYWALWALLPGLACCRHPS